jgi:hypothetical protein
MRIYNGTNSQLNLPFSAKERITIEPMSPSGNIMCSNEFLSLLISSYTTDEVAIIVSGPFEINACANVPAAVNYVVQSLDEAIQKFAIPSDEAKETVEPKVEEEVADELPQAAEEEVEAEPVAEVEPKPEVEAVVTKKKNGKKKK